MILEQPDRIPAAQRWRVIVFAFVLGLVGQLWPFALGERFVRLPEFYWDEAQYWTLSAGQLYNFKRPPAYPIMLKMMRVVCTTPYAVAFVQSLALAVIPVLVVVLAFQIGVRRRGVLIVAASVSALAFTSTTLSKRMLADGPAAVLYLLAIILAVRTIQKREILSATAAGICLALLGLTKPLFFILVPAFVLLLLNRDLRRRWILVVALLAPPMATAFLWSTVVRTSYGTRSVAGIGQLTINRYLVQATKVISQNGSWNDAQIRDQQNKTTYDTPLSVWHPSPEKFDKLTQENYQTLRAHPVVAIRAFALAVWRNLPRPFFPQELLTYRSGPRWFAVAGKGLTYILWLLCGIGAALSLRQRVEQRDALLVVTAAAGFVILTSGVAFWEGARLTFPALSLCLALSASGLEHLADFVERLRLRRIQANQPSMV